MALPVGFQFLPTDEELISGYLNVKLMNETIRFHHIHDVDIYQHNPQSLISMFLNVGNDECYFFTPRDRKYPNGGRPSRKAGTGFWKATSGEKPIRNDRKECIGYKQTLVFYEGVPLDSVKTNWIMHEYRADLPSRNRNGKEDMKLDDWVLCRIHLNTKNSGRRPRNHVVPPNAPDQIPEIHQVDVVMDERIGQNVPSISTYNAPDQVQDHSLPIYNAQSNTDFDGSIDSNGTFDDVLDLEGLFDHNGTFDENGGDFGAPSIAFALTDNLDDIFDSNGEDFEDSILEEECLSTFLSTCAPKDDTSNLPQPVDDDSLVTQRSRKRQRRDVSNSQDSTPREVHVSRNRSSLTKPSPRTK